MSESYAYPGLRTSNHESPPTLKMAQFAQFRSRRWLATLLLLAGVFTASPLAAGIVCQSEGAHATTGLPVAAGAEVEGNITHGALDDVAALPALHDAEPYPSSTGSKTLLRPVACGTSAVLTPAATLSAAPESRIDTMIHQVDELVPAPCASSVYRPPRPV